MQRLLSIDFLRGLAALGVVLHHACLNHPPEPAAGPAATTARPILGAVLGLGASGVWLFFVISGFCIHLRHARASAAGDAGPIDFAGFWKRRIVRLYPTYLVCLLIYLALNLWSGAVMVDGALIYNFCMHLLMLHNLDPGTTYGFCGVFWTLALEEQLYLAYFLLLALRRRLGWRRTLLVCFGVRVATYAAHVLADRGFGVDLPIKEMATSQWFVWALGAVAVEAHVGLIALPRWCRDLRAGAGLLGLAAACSSFVQHVPGAPLGKPIWFALDPLMGLGFFVVLNALVAMEPSWRSRGKPPRLVRRLARVGLFSYSLYLTHEIVLRYASGTIARGLGLANDPLLLLALTPLCLALAWVFFHLFERPFLHGPRPLRLPSAPILPAPPGLPATPA